MLMQMPGPRAFSVVQKPWGWAHISVQKPRGARGGRMVTGQIDTCITLCMKLPWFCHTKHSCPLFVTALVPGLFSGGKPAETCCHSVVAAKWLKTQSVCSAGRKYYNLNTNRDY